MSDEYRIGTGDRSVLEALARSLTPFGLAPIATGPNHVALAYPGAEAEVARWGGSARLELDEQGILITLNAVARRRELLAALRDALEQLGIDAELEEL